MKIQIAELIKALAPYVWLNNKPNSVGGHISANQASVFDIGSSTLPFRAIYADSLDDTYVPLTRTVNGLPLSSDITIDTQGGFASSYLFCEDTIFAGTTPVWRELERQSDGGVDGSHSSTGTSYSEMDRYVTEALDTTVIPGGLWSFTLFSKVSSQSGQVKADIYRVNSAGAIVGGVLATAETAVFTNTSVVGIPASVYLAEQTGWSLTDRIGVVISGKRIGGTATVTWYHDVSAGWSSSVQTPITLLHNQLNGLNQGDYRHLTAAQLTDLTDTGATTLHKHDHGGMDGLSDDDHPQYVLKSVMTTTGDMIYASGASTPARRALVVPNSTLRNVLGVENGETVPTWKAVFDSTNPTTITVSSSVGTGSEMVSARRDHVHGITTSNNPDAAYILASNSTGGLGLTKLTTPSIDAAANLTINPAGLLLFPQAQDIESDNYAAGIPIQGWWIGRYNGTGTPSATRNAMQIYSLTVDEFRARTFVADEVRVDRGEIMLTKSYGIVSRPFTVPAAPTTTVTAYFENSPALKFLNAAIFSSGDYLMFRIFDDSSGLSISNFLFTVSGYAAVGTTEQSWTLTLVEGTEGYEIRKGALGWDWGTSGQGYIHQSVVDASGAPYIDIKTWATSPGAGGPLDGTATTHVRIGALINALDATMLPSGWGLFADNAFLKGVLVAGNGSVSIDTGGINVASGDDLTTVEKRISLKNGSLTGAERGFIGMRTWAPARIHNQLAISSIGNDTGGQGQIALRSRSYGQAFTAPNDAEGSTIILKPEQVFIGIGAGVRIASVATEIDTAVPAGHLYVDTIHVTTLDAGTISGTSMSGATWTYPGSMTIDAKLGTATTVSIINSSAGHVDLSVDRNITLGGTVDGVDISAHAADANAHHNRSHSYDSASDHSGSLSWSKISLTSTGLTVGHVLHATSTTEFGFGAIAVSDIPAHNLLSTTHGDTTAASAVRGDIIIASGASPKWIRLAISVPAASQLNVIGVVNGETEPSWKSVFDATNPAGLGTAGPGTATTAAHRDHVHAMPAHDQLSGLADDDHTQYTRKDTLTAKGDIYIASAASTPARYGVSAPAANLLNVLGVANGDDTPTWKAIFDANNPNALGTASPGTVTVAAHRDHIHTLPKLDDTAAPDDNTDLNATTTAHGLLLKATAPAANVLNVVGIANGETAYTNKSLFDGTAVSTSNVSSSATAGTSLYAAHRDHIHAITTSNNPGATASILASGSDGALTVTIFGATTKVTTPLIEAAALLTLKPTTNVVLDPTGKYALPGGNNDISLGDLARRWKTLHVTELMANTLVKAEVTVSMQGRLLFTSASSSLIADLGDGAGDLTIDVKEDVFAIGEHILFETSPSGTPQHEIMTVTSVHTDITGGFRYTVTRNVDGTGCNLWKIGDVCMSLGYAAGHGYIDLIAAKTSQSTYGPSIVTYARTGTAWNAVKPTTVQGNMRSFVDYGDVNSTGFATGNDLTLSPSTGFAGITIDQTNGLRIFGAAFKMYDGSTQTFNLDKTTGITFADGDAGGITGASNFEMIHNNAAYNAIAWKSAMGDYYNYAETFAGISETSDALFSINLFNPNFSSAASAMLSMKTTAAHHTYSFWQVIGDTQYSSLYIYDDQGMRFTITNKSTLDTKDFVFTDGGSVGIGTSGPTAKLHVNDGSSNHVAIMLENAYMRSGIELENANLTNSGEAIMNVGLNTDRAIPNFGTANQYIATWMRFDTRSAVKTVGWFWRNAGSSTENQLMTLTYDGKLGLGMTAPEQLLSVAVPDAQQCAILLQQTNHVGWRIGMSASSHSLQFNSTSTDFSTTSKMVIDTDGNVGIGTTEPTAPLHFARATGDKIKFYEGAAGADTYAVQINSNEMRFYTDNAADFISLYPNNTLTLVAKNGNVGIGTTGPQQKLVVSDGRYGLEVAPSGSGYINLFGYDRTGNAYINLAIAASGGNVGIGTTGPLEALDVKGNLRVSSTTGAFRIREGGDDKVYFETDDNLNNAYNTWVTLDQSTGNVGIGRTDPWVPLVVQGARYTPIGGYSGVMAIISSNAYGGGVGGGLMLGGKYDGTNTTEFAQICGVKDNATSGNVDGSLTFHTRVAAGSMPEVARFNAAGWLGIGTTGPACAFHVTGSGTGHIAYIQSTSTNGAGLLIAAGVSGGYEALTIKDYNGTGGHYFYTSGNSWHRGEVSAGSFYDHTPGYDGDAVKELSRVRNKNGKIDHNSLPPAARKKFTHSDGTIEDNRDLSMMVSILTKAVQQLTDQNTQLSARISELEAM